MKSSLCIYICFVRFRFRLKRTKIFSLTFYAYSCLEALSAFIWRDSKYSIDVIRTGASNILLIDLPAHVSQIFPPVV